GAQHPLDRGGAGGKDLNQGQPRRLRAAGDLPGEGEDLKPKPFASLVLALGGGEDPAQRVVDDAVVGGKEALLLSGEVFVEISLRNAGLAGQCRHGDVVVTVLRDELDHRLPQSSTLMRRDALCRMSGPRPQLRVASAPRSRASR